MRSCVLLGVCVSLWLSEHADAHALQACPLIKNSPVQATQMLLLLVHASPVAAVPPLAQVHVLVVQTRSCPLSGVCVWVSPAEQGEAHATQSGALNQKLPEHAVQILLLLVHASPVAAVPPLAQVHVLVVQMRSRVVLGDCVSVSPAEQGEAHATQLGALKK